MIPDRDTLLIQKYIFSKIWSIENIFIDLTAERKKIPISLENFVAIFWWYNKATKNLERTTLKLITFL